MDFQEYLVKQLRRNDLSKEERSFLGIVDTLYDFAYNNDFAEDFDGFAIMYGDISSDDYFPIRRSGFLTNGNEYLVITFSGDELPEYVVDEIIYEHKDRYYDDKWTYEREKGKYVIIVLNNSQNDS